MAEVQFFKGNGSKGSNKVEQLSMFPEFVRKQPLSAVDNMEQVISRFKNSIAGNRDYGLKALNSAFKSLLEQEGLSEKEALYISKSLLNMFPFSNAEAREFILSICSHDSHPNYVAYGSGFVDELIFQTRDNGLVSGQELAKAKLHAFVAYENTAESDD